MDKWDEVWAELDRQLSFLAPVERTPETRTRTTMQCQRLLRKQYVALAVPVRAVRRKGTEDPKGNHVVGFTDVGPWLFTANPSNPGLPRLSVGAIPDPSPMSFGPHHREGGLLTIGGIQFLVPHAYAHSVRDLIVDLASRSQSD